MFYAAIAGKDDTMTTKSKKMKHDDKIQQASVTCMMRRIMMTQKIRHDIAYKIPEFALRIR